MSKLIQTKVSNQVTQKDTLKVNLAKGTIAFRARMVRYRDKDTRQIVCYIPSIDISGYGSDEKKALEMINFSVKEYFEFLTTLTAKKLEEELRTKGWHHTTFSSKKEFSKVSVSPDGELENFNAVADEVEELTLQA